MAKAKAIKFHPAADLFPLLTGESLAELVADVEKHGQLEPIVLCKGKILDGRNRYRACLELGVEPEFWDWDGECGDPVTYSLSKNVKRRHLTPSQLAMVALAALPLFEKEAAKRQGERTDLRAILPEGTGRRARDDAAKAVGVSARYVQDAKAISAASPELAEEVKAGAKTIPQAKREIAKAASSAKARAAPRVKLGRGVRVIHGDMNTAKIKAGSVDVIITDPPYPKEFLSVYGDLAKLADRVLKPGGSLFAMVGQSYLPTIMQALGAVLSYQWTIAYLTPGGQATQLWQRKAMTFWKPVLWYTRGPYSGKWVGDVAKSEVNDNDKQHHKWGQSESGMLDLVERCSEPGDLVLDPFMGAGTTGVACVMKKRRFIGVDLDGSHCDTAKDRMERAGAV